VLTAKKKIAVREVSAKPKVQELWDKLRDFTLQYRRPLAWGAGVLVVLVVIGYVYQSHRQTREEEAAIALRALQPMLQEGRQKQAIDGDPSQNVRGLRWIVDEYGNTTAGEIATLLLGNAYLATEQFDLALKTFDDSSPSGSLMTSNVLAGKAAAFEGKKNYAEAATFFEKAAKEYQSDFLTSTRYFQAGRAYCMAGQKTEARDMFDKVLKEGSSPRYDGDIKRLSAQYGIELDQ
jgi:predicted negative regulator of RcsB-dependent stress response